MSTTSFAILGGDLRQCYLADYLNTNGHEVTCFGTMPFSYSNPSYITNAPTLKKALEQARLVLCPVPFSVNAGFLNTPALLSAQLSFTELAENLAPGQLVVGGAIPADFIQTCARKQIPVWDFMEDEAVISFTASLTAEGLLAALITATPFSLVGRKLLLLGYGHCGRAIAKQLFRFDMDILVVEQEKERRVAARMDGNSALETNPDNGIFSSFDMVINTIPAPVLSLEQLAHLPKHCIFFDIASAPFGISADTISELKLNYLCCPGIPGQRMPQTVGEFIGKVILERMLSHGI